MLNIVYNSSPLLSETIREINIARTKILTHPLTVSEEANLRWNALVDRVFWSLSIKHQSLSRDQVAKLLLSPKKKRPNYIERDIYNYKKALDFIREYWLGSKNEFSSKEIKSLWTIACKPTAEATRHLFESVAPGLDNIFYYLQRGSEHPLVQAGIAMAQIMRSKPFSEGTERVSRLFANLVLFKYAYDCRGLVCFEEQIRKDLIGQRQAFDSFNTQDNLTAWLEYFTRLIATSLAKTLTHLDTHYSKMGAGMSTRLTQRENAILGNLEKPGSQITNRDVQKQFGISQITASRDLSKLARLGLIFPHGKGRSVSYIKV